MSWGLNPNRPVKLSDTSKLDTLGVALFWSGLITGVVSGCIVFQGFANLGAGHGRPTVWNFGFACFALADLLMLVSCISGFAVYRRRRMPLYPIPALLGFLLFSPFPYICIGMLSKFQ